MPSAAAAWVAELRCEGAPSSPARGRGGLDAERERELSEHFGKEAGHGIVVVTR
jgi:hypothetical protein